MAIHVALTHETAYRYDRPVKLGPQVIRLRPAPHSRTRILSYSLRVEPAEHFLNWQQDPQSNYLARLVIPEKTRDLKIVVDLTAEMAVLNPFDFFLEPSAEQFPFAYEPDLAKDLEPYLEAETAGPRLRAWLDSVPRTKTATADFLVGLNQRLQGEIGYVVRMEPGVQDCEQTLELARGSCRDSGWLLVQILRHLGLAARFVSGYLIQLVHDVKSLDGPSGTETDFTDLHAWAEVYLPGAGWIGFDPTSGLLAGEGHIPLACAPHPTSAAPITGMAEEAKVDFSFAMQVKRIFETPRVTKPYTEDQWAAIDALGQRVDDQLKADDVRLTLGGEPTFVSIDHVDEPEWSTEALGATKRPLAADLINRLRDRFAPKGLLHYGQGKWYPGEPLPRWAFSLYWRADGKPLWLDPSLIAHEAAGAKGKVPAKGEATPAEAERFGQTLARTLGVDPDNLLPAYEDPLPFVAREQRLPENVDLLDPRLGDPEARARLAREFERDLGAPVGYVLPIRRARTTDPDSGAGHGWRSERWKLKPGHLFLVPGDSPLGFRLPLESLPYVAPKDFPYYVPLDPFAERDALPDPKALHKAYAAAQGTGRGRAKVKTKTKTGDKVIRTALSIQPRDGRICIFLPPIESADDYVELVAAIEVSAKALGQPVHLEGYRPPADKRLNMLQVTPDPGVIEVNIQPAHAWQDLVENTTALYEEARLSRLGTEKFMVDGRHTGTGGGNHVVVGGASPDDSPFLRRPDLLRSLIAYWQNHPSLSFLFSGLFIGPTSQAPRVDEARNDSLYELEIAFRQIPEPEDEKPIRPWLIDRLLRNILIDVTGNTHRTEICIDKLYSPDGPTGRLGLVEFRAFEMPPHARMSLTQQLLLRALIARFWRTPYRGRLVPWGTALHDRFMLPHFVWQDFRDVLRDMDAAGYPLAENWFAPHFEFRFPLYGEVERDGVKIELRQALEPWHVLGEEGVVGATARHVDSSLERLQVRVEGLTAGRHLVTCNGKVLPLHSTETQGESVAGLRFRAWQPPRCLHPTIPVHAPLTFDLLDTWSERSLGGFTYHVAHPGGRNYDTFPVNSYEAESRRLARFFDIGHTPGRAQAPPLDVNPRLPMTLDLRLA